MDLLTVVLHELGHVLDLADDYSHPGSDQLMSGWLEAGVKRHPAASETDALFADSDWLNDQNH